MPHRAAAIRHSSERRFLGHRSFGNLTAATERCCRSGGGLGDVRFGTRAARAGPRQGGPLLAGPERLVSGPLTQDLVLPVDTDAPHPRHAPHKREGNHNPQHKGRESGLSGKHGRYREKHNSLPTSTQRAVEKITLFLTDFGNLRRPVAPFGARCASLRIFNRLYDARFRAQEGLAPGPPAVRALNGGRP
jgi:hypothetical protein